MVALRQQLMEQAREAAKKESQIILEQTRKQIDIEREKAMQEIRSQVASLSVEVAEKILSKQLDSDIRQLDLINHLVDESIKPRA